MLLYQDDDAKRSANGGEPTDLSRDPFHPLLLLLSMAVARPAWLAHVGLVRHYSTTTSRTTPMTSQVLTRFHTHLLSLSLPRLLISISRRPYSLSLVSIFILFDWPVLYLISSWRSKTTLSKLATTAEKELRTERKSSGNEPRQKGQFRCPAPSISARHKTNIEWIRCGTGGGTTHYSYGCGYVPIGRHALAPVNLENGKDTTTKWNRANKKIVKERGTRKVKKEVKHLRYPLVILWCLLYLLALMLVAMIGVNGGE